MANENIRIELTDEEKMYAAKAAQIKEQMMLAGTWPKEPLYKQLEVLLDAYGTKELGVKKWRECHLISAMEHYGGYDRHKKVANFEIEIVYAQFLADTIHQQKLCPNMFDQAHLTKFQEVCAKVKRDSISMKVNVSEEGYVKSSPAHKTVKSDSGNKYYNTINPAIQQQINAIKAGETYSFETIISSLKEKGLSIDMQDGLAHVFVETEGNRIDAGIIRPGSIVADLTALDEKCLSLGKGINLSVVINKAGGSNNKNPEDPKIKKSAAEAVKEENVITEEEIMLDNIRYLLEDNLAEVEKRGQNVIITGDTGHMAILISGTMVEFGRILYSRCGEIFNEEHVAAIRKGLEELFGNDKAKQKTPQTETVKTVLTEAEEDLVSEGTSATVDIVFDVELPDGRLVKVTRRTSVKQDDKDPNFLYGYIYRDGKYVGSWIWNRKYSLPVYKPQQAMKKTALGERNSRRLCVAIKKAVCGK